MIRIYEGNSQPEAAAITAALEAAGIESNLQGEATGSLPGFYVPNVLQIFVIDHSRATEAHLIADGVISERTTTNIDKAKSSRPKAIIWIGFLFIGIVFACFLIILFSDAPLPFMPKKY